MGIDQVGDVLIYMGTIAGALAAIGIVLRVGVVRPLKNWLERYVITAIKASARVSLSTADTAQKVLEQVESPTGSSIRTALDRMEAEQIRQFTLLELHTRDPRAHEDPV